MSKNAATTKNEGVQFNKTTVRAVIACVLVLAMLCPMIASCTMLPRAVSVSPVPTLVLPLLLPSA